MFNPYTGKPLSNLIFVGPIFYQRLRHMVEDKMYARARGVIVALTRQPTHGRNRGGGLRFGEMERDCVLSHGISKFLQERLFKVSDMFRVHVCSKCGLLAEVNLEHNSAICRYCLSRGVIWMIFLEKERVSKNLSDGDPICGEAALAGINGNARASDPPFQYKKNQHMIFNHGTCDIKNSD